MSETTLVLLVTAAVIGVMFAWVPALHFVCPPCGRYVSRLRRRQREAAHENSSANSAETA